MLHFFILTSQKPSLRTYEWQPKFEPNQFSRLLDTDTPNIFIDLPFYRSFQPQGHIPQNF